MKIMKAWPKHVRDAAASVGVQVDYEIVCRSRGHGQTLRVKINPLP